MILILFCVLLGVPLLELFVIFQVSGLFGFLRTVILMILVSGVGAWMVHRSGFGVVRKIKARLDRQELPAVELLDGVLIVLAGAFMLTPGFFTDLLGLVLLVKPTRALVRLTLVRCLSRKMREAGWGVGAISGLDGPVGGFSGPAGGGPGNGAARELKGPEPGEDR